MLVGGGGGGGFSIALVVDRVAGAILAQKTPFSKTFLWGYQVEIAL